MSILEALLGGLGADSSGGRGEGTAEAGTSPRRPRSAFASLLGADVMSSLMGSELLQSMKAGGGERIELPTAPPCISKSIKDLATELSDLVTTLKGLGGACNLHGNEIDSIIQKGRLVSYRQAKETINLTTLVKELEHALAAVRALKTAAPPTSGTHFEALEARLTQAITDWNGLEGYDPAQDRRETTISVTITGNPEDVAALSEMIKADMANRGLHKVMETGKKYGCEFMLAPCGHLLSKQRDQAPVHHGGDTGEALKAKVTEAGITLRDLTSDDLLSGLPVGMRGVMGSVADLFSFLDSSPFAAGNAGNNEDEDEDEDDEDEDDEDEDDEDEDDEQVEEAAAPASAKPSK